MKIDELIGKQERLIALLQEKRQALISHAVTKGLNPDAPMKNSGIDWLGEVPANWKPYKLGMVADYFSGATPSKDNLRYWDGGIPWVTPKDMKRRYIDSSEDTISSTALQETNLILFEPSILLVVVRGMILAHTLPVALTTVPVTINQDMKALKLARWLNIEFFAYFLQGLSSTILSLLVEESAHGTKVIRMDGWKHFLVFLPEVSEQSKIKDWIDTQIAKLNSLIKKAQQQIVLLQEHRMALISSAVTGKIDVRQYRNGNLSNY